MLDKVKVGFVILGNLFLKKKSKVKVVILVDLLVGEVDEEMLECGFYGKKSIW